MSKETELKKYFKCPNQKYCKREECTGRHDCRCENCVMVNCNECVEWSCYSGGC